MSLEIFTDETAIMMTAFASAFFSVLAVWYGLIAKKIPCTGGFEPWPNAGLN